MNQLNLNDINTMMMPFNIIPSQNNFINNNNNDYLINILKIKIIHQK